MAFRSYMAMVFIILFMGFGFRPTQGQRITREDDIELEEQLKILNKPAVKSIQDESGVLFDCIDIYKQPAFDHPLLRNHKIQMKPTSSVTGFNNESSHQREHFKILPTELDCPEGSVPIRRTQKEDLLRAKYVNGSDFMDIHPLGTGSQSEHYAALRSNNVVNPIYHGAEAGLNVINPEVADDQSSMALMWFASGVNMIVTGWGVSPRLYGDHKTHFISYWKSAKGGCFNLLCSGFVQVDRSSPMDKALPNSVYGAPQNEAIISIHQDKNTGNWWLTYPVNSRDVGYWPAALFTSLSRGATTIQFGGFVRGPKDKGTPPMGWGKFPKPDFYTSGYFTNMKIFNYDYSWTGLVGADMSVKADCPKRYGVKSYWDRRNLYNIRYGGPGGKYCD